MSMRDKAVLRRTIRGLYPGDEARNAHSAALCRQVLGWPVYQQAQVVCGYVPLRREADIMPLLRDVLSSGKCLVLPRVEGEGRMTLRRVETLEALLPGAYGIPEPGENAPLVRPEEIDLLLTPLEAIDETGMRLGKGGGYYDRLLPQIRGLSAGMALPWQRVREVPREPWDRPLDAVVDSEGITLFDAKRHGKG